MHPIIGTSIRNPETIFLPFKKTIPLPLLNLLSAFKTILHGIFSHVREKQTKQYTDKSNTTLNQERFFLQHRHVSL